MKEQDIRPSDLFARYLALAEADIERYFRDMSEFRTSACPACGEGRPHHEFEKHGFQYCSCPVCHSLYLNPRPTPEAIDRYYRDSAAAEFWSREFYPATAAARRERIWKPRALAAAKWAIELGVNDVCLDVGPGYGLFMEEVNALGDFRRVVGVEPNPSLAAECRKRGLEIVESTIEGLEKGSIRAGFAANFEVLEHVPSPRRFLEAIYRALRPGGVLFLTTLTCSGWDIQELWQHSKSVYPPHHINLISVQGMRTLFEASGFEIVDLSTPGELDVDIVANALKENAALPVSRFARSVATADEGTRAAFQSFLRSHRLSSHIRVVARRIEEVR